jgi:hypothetical protein
MDSKFKVTDIPEESSFYDLVSGDNILEIPLFQRPYMWKETHYRTMLTDIEIIRDDPTSAIFLGVIVTYSRGSGPGRPPTWMIVDGQQRITTLYLSAMAAIQVAAQNGDLDWAADMIGRYLVVRPMSGLQHNTKLVPSFNDRAQFANIWSKLSSVKNLSSHSMFAFNPPRPPAPGGLQDGAMTKQYAVMLRDLSKVYKDGGLDAVSERLDITATKLSVVSISLREPTVAPKIFERLNFGAEPITVADLVRNEIFARSGDDLTIAQTLFDTKWEPFISKFKDKNADLNKFLFPYGLISNPNIKRNDLFLTIRSTWDSFSGPAEIISHLEQYQGPYIAVNYGEGLANVSKGVNLRIKRLAAMNRPSSIYPFVLPLLKGYCDEEVGDETVCDVLDQIESFLFRRAVAGIEPTGLHAVFKGLWRELTSEAGSKSLDECLSLLRLRAAILGRATIAWPSDDEFQAAIILGPLYRRKIAGYAIREYELGLDDECPLDIPQIEHIAPQKKPASWSKTTQEEYDKIIHTWGNLVPISPEMNPSASAKEFSEKKASYVKSKFPSVRHLTAVKEWDSAAIARRSKEIADWAVKRWAY